VDCRENHGGVEASRTALLSQEGSTIETAVEIVRGVVPEPHSLRMHSETFRLGNHPSRHRKERDDAALLTQEGNFACVHSYRYTTGRMASIALPGGFTRHAETSPIQSAT
jgi:hypothetical protein